MEQFHINLISISQFKLVLKVKRSVVSIDSSSTMTDTELYASECDCSQDPEPNHTGM